MILRRVIDHVKSQNWTAIFLDFVIVVMGVFIGIQVSNWNAARAEKVAVRQHLSEIMDDIAADVAHFDEQIRATTWRVAAIRRLLGENDYMFEHAAIAGEPSLPKKNARSHQCRSRYFIGASQRCALVPGASQRI